MCNEGLFKINRSFAECMSRTERGLRERKPGERGRERGRNERERARRRRTKSINGSGRETTVPNEKADERRERGKRGRRHHRILNHRPEIREREREKTRESH